MFNRVCYVEFLTANNEIKRLQGIDVKFYIEKHLGAMMNNATIEMCNLATEDVEFLTTFTSQWIAINQRKRIRVFGGYEDTSVSLLFDGDIIEATPTLPPDIWLICKARSGNYGNSTVISKSINQQLPAKEVFKQVSNWARLPLQDYSTTNKQINGFDFSGGSTQIINQLNQIGGIIAYEEDGNLKIVDEKAPNIGGEVRKISLDSGMVGIPKVDALGCEITTFLDPVIKLGQRIELESIRIPAANGIYWIYELRHDGHLRGNDFHTIMKGRRFSV